MNKYTSTNRLIATVFACSFLLIIAKGLYGIFHFAWEYATPIVEYCGAPMLSILLIFSILKVIDGIIIHFSSDFTSTKELNQHYESFLRQRYQQLQTDCHLLSQRKNQMLKCTHRLPAVSPVIRQALLHQLRLIEQHELHFNELSNGKTITPPFRQVKFPSILT